GRFRTPLPSAGRRRPRSGVNRAGVSARLGQSRRILMTSRDLVATSILAFLSTLSGSVAAQEAKPQEGPGAPKPAESAAQPPPDQAPAAPSEPAPAPPPYVAPPSDVALSPVAEEGGAGATYKRRMVFEAALGYTGGGTIKHPELSTHEFSGEMLEIAGGVEL